MLQIPLNFAYSLLALELTYPSLPGVGTLNDITTLGGLVLYIFQFALITSGILLFVVGVTLGIRFIASGGAPAKVLNIKQRFAQLVVGALILLGASLIVGVINPELRVLSVPFLEPIESDFKLEEPEDVTPEGEVLELGIDCYGSTPVEAGTVAVAEDGFPVGDRYRKTIDTVNEILAILQKIRENEEVVINSLGSIAAIATSCNAKDCSQVNPFCSSTTTDICEERDFDTCVRFGEPPCEETDPETGECIAFGEPPCEEFLCVRHHVECSLSRNTGPACQSEHDAMAGLSSKIAAAHDEIQNQKTLLQEKVALLQDLLKDVETTVATADTCIAQGKHLLDAERASILAAVTEVAARVNTGELDLDKDAEKIDSILNTKLPLAEFGPIGGGPFDPPNREAPYDKINLYCVREE